MAEETQRAAPFEPEPFVIMAKPVGPACNMICSYCYYLDTAGIFPKEGNFRMSPDVLETYIRQYLASSPGPEVLFVWHGGEPALAGLDFYRRAVELQQRYTPEGWSCRNNLQTNGTLLDDEWCSFLAEHSFDVGVSIDGTQWLHDRYRKDRQGQGTYKRTADSILRLQKYGIQPDLLCTVTAASASEPLSVYRALREFNTGWVQFIPIVKRTPDGNVTPESVTGKAYGKFLATVFDDWLYNDYGSLNVQLFAEMSLVWAGGSPTACWMAPTCGRVLIVEHDGGVFSCDHFVDRQHYLGNISDTRLADLTDSPEQSNFGENKRNLLPRECLSCRWLGVCNGLCPKDRFISSEDGEPGLNYLCEGLKYFYSYAEKPLKQVIAQRKNGISPEVLRRNLHSKLIDRWKGIGRNDLCPCGSGKKAKNCCWELRP
jgi:uncharacterized protein